MIDSGVIDELHDKFSRIGANVKVRFPVRFRDSSSNVLIDVKNDEYFDLAFDALKPIDVKVLDCKPKDRHLLLQVTADNLKSKFLCGHDERHWFVAAVPEKVRGVTSVKTAMEALKPVMVQERQKGVKTKDKFRRKNAAYVRQGEWFFVPVDIEISETFILRNEPLRRNPRSKPHIAELCYRRGGELVYVNHTAAPLGITQTEYNRMKRTGIWNSMVRNPEVYVQGRVSHSDHKTIILKKWHQVLMNTEHLAIAMSHVAFFD